MTNRAREFSIAHELMEIYLPRKLRTEDMCNRGAAALLLPWIPYLRDLARHELELPIMRARWPLASYPTLARRLVDLHPRAAATIWRRGHPHKRYCKAFPAELTEAEALAARQLAQSPAQRRTMVEASDTLCLSWKLPKSEGLGRAAISLAVPV